MSLPKETSKTLGQYEVKGKQKRSQYPGNADWNDTLMFVPSKDTNNSKPYMMHYSGPNAGSKLQSKPDTLDGESGHWFNVGTREKGTLLKQKVEYQP